MTRNKRVLIAGSASAVLLVAVTVLTVVFGIVEVPTFPTQASQPISGLTGKIAYAQFEEENNGSSTCVYVIDVNELQPQRITCNESPEYVWLDNGHLAVSNQTASFATDAVDVRIFDPQTRAEAGVLRTRRTSFESTAGSTELTLSDGGAALSKNGSELVSLGGPADYTINDAQSSPDGKAFVIADSEGRILLATADGQTVRTLVESKNGEGFYYGSGSTVTWYQAGSTANTVTAQELEENGMYWAAQRYKAQYDFD